MRKLLICLMGVLMIAGCGSAIAPGRQTQPENSPRANATPAESKYNSNDRIMSYSASMNLKVSDKDKARVKVSSKVHALVGHVLEDDDNRIIVNVPSNDFDDFIEFLKSEVGSVENLSKKGMDSTESYVDDKMRLDALKATRGRYADLLKKTTKVEEILKIEKELERVNGDILRLESRQQRAEKSTEYTRVVISLDESTLLGGVARLVLGPVLALLFVLIIL